MTAEAFGQDWSGVRGDWSASRRPWQGRRCSPPNWFFSRGGRGRPPFADIEDLIALGRMWKGAPFGGPGWGPHRRGPRRARRGDVRLALLRLVAEQPRNGYQLIQAIEERSEGLWRPSPGSVYPTLAQLEDEGLIRSAEAEGARVFEITDAGREDLASRAGEPDPWQPATDDLENPLAELGPLVIQIGKATFQVASVGDRAQRDQARRLLSDTRRALYRILAEDADAGADEAEDAPREM
jgi:DNA-binding PadR family transcriptional regulator